MDLFHAIKGRTSIRRFKDQPVPDGDTEMILDAGRPAPSANNTQPWSFLVIRDKAVLKLMAGAVREMVDRMIPHAGDEKQCLLAFVREGHDDRLSVVNPQTGNVFHKKLH